MPMVKLNESLEKSDIKYDVPRENLLRQSAKIVTTTTTTSLSRRQQEQHEQLPTHDQNQI